MHFASALGPVRIQNPEASFIPIISVICIWRMEGLYTVDGNGGSFEGLFDYYLSVGIDGIEGCLLM